MRYYQNIFNHRYKHLLQLLQRGVLFIFLFNTLKSNSQVCSPDIFFHRYQGNAAFYVASSITTVQNETLTAGAALHFKGPFNDATDGWITKLSARGNVLWSKRYFFSGFNSGGFSCIQNATDSTYFVTGRFGFYVKEFNGSVQELNASTFLMHLDKFGNPIWIKRITNFITNSNLATIIKITDNSFVVAGTVWSNGTNRLLLVGIDLNGNAPWYKVYRQDSVQLTTPAAKLLNNGELLLTGAVQIETRITTGFSNQGYYMIKVDPLNGSLLMNKSILTSGSSLNGIERIYQNGDSLYMYTSFSDRYFTSVPFSKDAAVLKVGTNGAFYSAKAYNNGVPGCILLDGKYNYDGTHTLLVDNGLKSIRTRVTNAETILEQHAYPLVNGNLKASKLLDRNPSDRILYIGRTQVPLLGLMKTEPKGSIHCMDGSATMTGRDISSFFGTGNLSPVDFLTNPVYFEQYDGGVGRKDYTYIKTTDCIETCCNNIRSDTSHIELCNAQQYKLPDNSIVRETGLYYTSYTTANDCDSIAYHEVFFSSKPKVNLGPDICFNNQDHLTLATDSGYRQYNWMGNLTSSHTYIISDTGLYKVSVANQCGTAEDMIQVYGECEFPVYIPTGFTPNNDGLNDQFGYPALNKNRFISMAIYNRYGELIFFSNNPSQQWDGKYKGMLQDTGLFVYIFRLKTLDDKPLFKKGTVLLIR